MTLPTTPGEILNAAAAGLLVRAARDPDSYFQVPDDIATAVALREPLAAGWSAHRDRRPPDVETLRAQERTRLLDAAAAGRPIDAAAAAARITAAQDTFDAWQGADYLLRDILDIDVLGRIQWAGPDVQALTVQHAPTVIASTLRPMLHEVTAEATPAAQLVTASVGREFGTLVDVADPGTLRAWRNLASLTSRWQEIVGWIDTLQRASGPSREQVALARPWREIADAGERYDLGSFGGDIQEAQHWSGSNPLGGDDRQRLVTLIDAGADFWCPTWDERLDMARDHLAQVRAAAGFGPPPTAPAADRAAAVAVAAAERDTFMRQYRRGTAYSGSLAAISKRHRGGTT